MAGNSASTVRPNQKLFRRILELERLEELALVGTLVGYSPLWDTVSDSLIGMSRSPDLAPPIQTGSDEPVVKASLLSNSDSPVLAKFVSLPASDSYDAGASLKSGSSQFNGSLPNYWSALDQISLSSVDDFAGLLQASSSGVSHFSRFPIAPTASLSQSGHESGSPNAGPGGFGNKQSVPMSDSSPPISPPISNLAPLLFPLGQDGPKASGPGRNSHPHKDPPAPRAVDDILAPPNNDVQYVAYSFRAIFNPMMEPLPTLNVAADAGVLVNDIPGTAGDVLIATLAGHSPPSPGGTTTGSTTLGGTVTLMSDGSFSYTPPASQANVIDSFNYYDAEAGAPNSNCARVDIYVSGDYTAQNLRPGLQAHLESSSIWPKYHADASNSGHAPFGLYRTEIPLSLTDVFQTASGGPTMFGSGVTYASFNLYIEDTGGISAYNMGNGAQIWRNTITAQNSPVGQPQYRAPAIVDSFPNVTILTGTSGGAVPASLVALKAADGSLLGSFRAVESYNGTSTSSLGPVASSPTVDPQLQSNVGGAIFFGSDGRQNHGSSLGKMYALNADGSVRWLTLLAGQIHGSPLLASTGLTGVIFVGTLPNDWTGRPGPVGSTQGRFYMLDEGTGAVLAEVFAPLTITSSRITSSANGAGGGAIFASEDGTIQSVSTTILPPPPGMESPTLTSRWTFLGNPQPTSPANDASGNVVYVGDNGGVRALNVNTGAQLFYFAAGPVTGAPAVTVNRTTAGVFGEEVAFGTAGPMPKFYEIDSTSGALVSDPVPFTQAILTAPAMSQPVVPSPIGNTGDFFVGTIDGKVHFLA